MLNGLITLLSGLLFGAGLVVSGMADPAKVLGFLTLDANWDPSLAVVMAGGLAVTMPGFAWLRRRRRPLLANTFAQPASTAISTKAPPRPTVAACARPRSTMPSEFAR